MTSSPDRSCAGAWWILPRTATALPGTTSTQLSAPLSREITTSPASAPWPRRQRFQSGPLAIVFDECYGRVVDAKTRRDALDTAIAELAASEPYLDVVERGHPGRPLGHRAQLRLRRVPERAAGDAA